MKLLYEQSKGNRFKSQMYGFEALDYTWAWNCELKRWTNILEVGKYSYRSHAPCKSVRAFRRMLKRAPNGVKFKLWSKYDNCCVYGFGSAQSLNINS
jgi:hypothetical protein